MKKVKNHAYPCVVWGLEAYYSRFKDANPYQSMGTVGEIWAINLDFLHCNLVISAINPDFLHYYLH